MFASIAFVVWRESVEALLVIGILDAWLVSRSVETRRARGFLWGGAAAGLGVAGVLAGLLLWLGETVSDDAQTIYQTVIALLAAGLILQMVFWMRSHGRSMRGELESSLSTAVAAGSWWGVFALALIAVAREGSETVVFIYGILSAGVMGSLLAGILAGVTGFVAAAITYALLMTGSRVISWRVFFRISEIVLLFLACGLLMTGIDGLINLDILPRLSRALWNSNFLMSDGTTVGGFFASMTGYRARPNLMQLIVFFGYWIAVLAVIYRPRKGSFSTASHH
ncbi:FTR1 family iron permease [Aliirhizobium cellulosilyticum]|jgi:high-affinity iron transporter|uniref:High-affinity iron transporter n=1 Tax=Aliirhizobium cellulosilyticum TaxID=393664 RepID=A0A7W6V2H1_9HYPH|nr:FTR1 family protein [Rhizobium cellulosilyticum]MBB4350057.1 high-affinity iron transporter [Rhizobium cellulosilyticum]MBB4413236.1 high-affinity iron transporter [Rhizobium cellulosilyticum]MBB4447826.1 high-affinity iron transporter [Rhizobium cellulosilyticum]